MTNPDTLNYIDEALKIVGIVIPSSFIFLADCNLAHLPPFQKKIKE
jgi:hypothetical protein